jgi:uncharacterized protein YlxW (UPF0749 family)
MDILKIIDSVLAFILHILPYLAGIATVFLGILLFKQTKRLKTTQADNSEIDSIRKIIETLEKDRDNLSRRVTELEKRELNYRQDALAKDMQLVDYEGMLIQYKRIFNYGCENFDTTCPIGKKYREFLEHEKGKLV